MPGSSVFTKPLKGAQNAAPEGEDGEDPWAPWTSLEAGISQQWF